MARRANSSDKAQQAGNEWQTRMRLIRSFGLELKRCKMQELSVENHPRGRIWKVPVQ